MNPTFSAIERAMACGASMTLPQAILSRAFAEDGTAIHAYLADETHNIDRVPESVRARCRAIDLSQLPAGAEWGHEITLAYDPQTDEARELGRDLKRDYSAARAAEYVGTCDVIGVTPDAVIVGDYKSGFLKVTKASDNWQLMVGALAACRAYGRDRAILWVIYLPEGEDPMFDKATMDALDLDMVRASLKKLSQRLMGPQTPTEGDHCRYCPAISACPPKLALIRAACTDPAALRYEITPTNATEAYLAMRRAESVIKQLKAALSSYSFGSPIDVGDGMVYGPKTEWRESLNPICVEAALEKLYGPKVARAALELTATKASVGRAVEACGRGAKQRAFAAIRAAGGVEMKQVTKVAEFRARGGRVTEQIPLAVAQVETEANALTEKIHDCDREKERLMAAAKFPIKGLAASGHARTDAEVEAQIAAGAKIVIQDAT